jgi:glycosyltransferase 2 family protein
MLQTEPAVKASTSEKDSALRKAIFVSLRVAFGVAILVYLAKSGRLDFSSLERLQHEWRLTVAAVGFLLLDIFFMSVRASLLFRSARLSLSLMNSIQLNLVGFLFSTFLPGAAGGDIAKVVYATRENHGRRTEVTTVLILDRVVGLFSLVLLPLLFAPFFSDLVRSVPALRRILVVDALLAISMAAGSALVMFFSPTRNLVSRSLSWWPNVQSLAVRVVDALSVHGKDQLTLIYAFLLSLLANLALVVVTGLALFAVYPAAFSIRLVLVAPVGHLVNSLPLTPGGIGVGESAFNALFLLTGIQGGAAALLCMRLWNCVVGVLGLALCIVGINRVVYSEEELKNYARAEELTAESIN